VRHARDRTTCQGHWRSAIAVPADLLEAVDRVAREAKAPGPNDSKSRGSGTLHAAQLWSPMHLSAHALADPAPAGGPTPGPFGLIAVDYQPLVPKALNAR
jgi:hypothetical protein